MNDAESIAGASEASTPQISREDARKIERYITAQKLAPKPLTSHLGGRIFVDSKADIYVHHNGGLRRAMIREDGQAQPLTKWTKARRKAEKRARRRQRT